MRSILRLLTVPLMVAVAMMAVPLSAGASTSAPINFHAWTSTADFQSGTIGGSAKITNWGGGAVTLGSHQTDGSWTSPDFNPGFDFNWVVSSWQVDTPGGSWIQMFIRAHVGDHETKWYAIGSKWAYDSTAIQRTSVSGQDDADAFLLVDTWFAVSTPGSSYQLQIALHGDGINVPNVRQVAATSSNIQSAVNVTSATTMPFTIDLPVPQRSQYVHDGEFPQFNGGGEAWCSPTSTAMILDYWHSGPSDSDLQTLPSDPVFDAHGRVDSEVDWAAIHTFDLDYGGTGNWPFNTAYASHFGLDGSVRQANSLRDLEYWVQRGVPTVVSINWDNTSSDPNMHLDGTSISSTAGHLMVVRGFTKSGDVIANDPATPLANGGDAGVRHVYNRAQFEFRWNDASADTYYLVKPYWLN